MNTSPHERPKPCHRGQVGLTRSMLVNEVDNEGEKYGRLEINDTEE